MKKLLSTIICMVCCGIADTQHTYTLDQLLDSARHNNIAMRSGRLSVEAAQEQSRESFTKYFPNVSGTAAWFNANKPLVNIDLAPLGMPTAVGLVKDGTLAGLTALQPVFAGVKIVNSNRLAKVGEDVARLQLQLSENEVERQTEQYFWQLVTLQEKLRTIDVVDTLLSDIAKDVSVAVRAGVALRNDLLQVQLRQNDMQSQRLKVENGISIVRLLLAQYTGLTPDPIPADAPTRLSRMVRWSNGLSIEPLSASIYLNTVYGHEFWKSQPSRYPDDYYQFMSTKFRLNIALGQQITWQIPTEKRRRYQSVTLFYEFSTCDLYIRSKVLEHSIPLKDIFGLSIGLKLIAM